MQQVRILWQTTFCAYYSLNSPTLSKYPSITVLTTNFRRQSFVLILSILLTKCHWQGIKRTHFRVFSSVRRRSTRPWLWHFYRFRFWMSNRRTNCNFANRIPQPTFLPTLKRYFGGVIHVWRPRLQTPLNSVYFVLKSKFPMSFFAFSVRTSTLPFLWPNRGLK